MNLVRRYHLICAKVQVGINAPVVLENGRPVVAYSVTHVQRGKRSVADTTQPGEHGMDQGLEGEALKVVSYQPIRVLAQQGRIPSQYQGSLAQVEP
jgi:hypothetical protein